MVIPKYYLLFMEKVSFVSWQNYRGLKSLIKTALYSLLNEFCSLSDLNNIMEPFC